MESIGSFSFIFHSYLKHDQRLTSWGCRIDLSSVPIPSGIPCLGWVPVLNCYNPQYVADHTWWFIPRIVSGWTNPGYFNGISGGKSSTYNWGELTHLRFVGWTTKYDPQPEFWTLLTWFTVGFYGEIYGQGSKQWYLPDHMAGIARCENSPMVVTGLDPHGAFLKYGYPQIIHFSGIFPL